MLANVSCDLVLFWDATNMHVQRFDLGTSTIDGCGFGLDHTLLMHHTLNNNTIEAS